MDEILPLDELGGNQPLMEASENGDVNVTTYTALAYNATDEYRAADTFATKLKSREALLELLLDVELQENITVQCADVNRVRCHN